MSTLANQPKLDAVEDLAVLAEEAGLTLFEMAVAFVLNHPDVLDRIDDIVAPAVTVNPIDNSYGDHELRRDQRRRP